MKSGCEDPAHEWARWSFSHPRLTKNRDHGRLTKRGLWCLKICFTGSKQPWNQGFIFFSFYHALRTMEGLVSSLSHQVSLNRNDHASKTTKLYSTSCMHVGRLFYIHFQASGFNIKREIPWPCWLKRMLLEGCLDFSTQHPHYRYVDRWVTLVTYRERSANTLNLFFVVVWKITIKSSTCGQFFPSAIGSQGFLTLADKFR